MRPTDRLAQVGRSGPLFHGGCPWLRPGQLVQPPAVTSVAVAQVERKRPNRVYFCQDPAVASYFGRLSTVGAGAGWLSAALYEVEPVGLLRTDEWADEDAYNLLDVELLLHEQAGRRGTAPRLSAGRSFHAPAARVLRVVRTNLRMSRREVEAHHELARRRGWTWSYDRMMAAAS